MIDLLLGRKIPTLYQHYERNKYNKIPLTDIVCNNVLNIKNYRIFIEEVFESDDLVVYRQWEEQPWYRTILHNPIINIKLLCTDDNTHGSSEIIVRRKDVRRDIVNKCFNVYSNKIKTGSYNYRDFNVTSSIQHVLADVLPNILYCKCRYSKELD